jgi:ATP-binding protein involved in chromosome partitioning
MRVNKFLTISNQILGVVENMSHFVCPKCHHESHIFGSHDALLSKAEKMGLDILGRIPLSESICNLSDQGKPIVVMNHDGIVKESYAAIAQKTLSKLALVSVA